jgi:hypothetical protein
MDRLLDGNHDVAIAFRKHQADPKRIEAGGYALMSFRRGRTKQAVLDQPVRLSRDRVFLKAAQRAQRFFQPPEFQPPKLTQELDQLVRRGIRLTGGRRRVPVFPLMAV